MAGKLSGVSVGPGNPGLLTLKARQVLEAAEVIAYPVKTPGGESTALSIIKDIIDLSGKEIVEVLFEMERDQKKREQCRKTAAALLTRYLDQGKDIAMITLGDAAIYSTYTYVHKLVRHMGYETEIVPGISSFSSGAALAQLGLVEGNEGLAVISALKGIDYLENTLKLFENVVVMKAGRKLNEILDFLEAKGLENRTMVLCNIGMADEYIGPMDPGRRYGYFTTLIIKQGGLSYGL